MLQGGTVVDEINRLAAQGKTLDTREALSIFLQVLGVSSGKEKCMYIQHPPVHI